MLDDISLYWFTDTAASSARIYWENTRAGMAGTVWRTDRTANGGVGLSARDILSRQRPGLRRCGPTCFTGMSSTGAAISPRSSSQSSSPRSCGRPSGHGEPSDRLSSEPRAGAPPSTKCETKDWEQLMKDDLENRAEVAVPVVSRREFILAAAATGGAGILSAGLGPISAHASFDKAAELGPHGDK